MRSNQQGVVSIIVLGLILLVLVAGGAYYIGTQNASSNQVTQSTPLPIAQTETPAPKKLAPLEGSFQEILSENCPSISLSGNSSINAIDVNKAPILIDQTKVAIKFVVPNKLACIIQNENNKPGNSLSLQLIDQSEIDIYNDDSLELGHDGAPRLGSYGTIISNDKDLEISVFISGGGGPAIVGSNAVQMRGRKKLLLSTGETIYANYGVMAIKGNDPRLVAFLTPYSQPYEFGTNNERELVKLPEAEIKAEFFSDLTKLQGTEKAALDTLKNTLSGITPR